MIDKNIPAAANTAPGTPAPWSEPPHTVFVAHQVDPAVGLSDSEAARRLQRDGPNELRRIASRNVWSILFDQFKSLVVGLLAAAAILSFAFAQYLEGGAVLAVLGINALIGFVTELRATRSMEALRQLGKVHANVRRNGRILSLPAPELVSGDIVVFEGGDVVTADMRILQASKLTANESTLTGEAYPVHKQTEPVPIAAPLAERSSMLFKGTSITRGSGEAIVVATGMRSQLGEIASLVAEAESEITPLEQRLNKLGQALVWATLAIAAAVVAAGLAGGKDPLLVVETALALAVAAVPEGLPIIATIALARGMVRMVARNALVRRLSAVETLGATGVICTDKTGTLTENRMTVTTIALHNADITIIEDENGQSRFVQDDQTLDTTAHPALRSVLKIGALCSNATLNAEGGHGDPLEVALLLAANAAGLQREELLKSHPEQDEVAFDPDIKMMATLHGGAEHQQFVAVKGAPEAVLACATSSLHDHKPVPLDAAARNEWLARAEQLTSDGLRVIAVAQKDHGDSETTYQELTLVGLVGMQDPPRVDVAPAIAACQRAGVRVVMVTGDHPTTAANIAAAVGIEHADEVVLGDRLESDDDPEILQHSIFARVSPKQKLNLIERHQSAGHIVAMTGDGVNDAPALHKADIGIAMGKRGTEVAREAASLVLLDDAFATIEFAIRQGRVIFANIRKFIMYLMSCNLSEVLVVSLAIAFQAPLPLLPLQILFLNLVTDVFPALALGVGEGEGQVMNHPPRDPREPILTRQHWLRIGLYAAVLTVAVLGVFTYCLQILDHAPRVAGTAAFCTLAFAQILHVFNMRADDSRLWLNEITRNPYVWGAVVLCVVLVLLAVYIPPVAEVMQLIPLGIDDWLVVGSASAAALIVIQVFKTVAGQRQSPAPQPD